jgi:hypothetical protein
MKVKVVSMFPDRRERVPAWPKTQLNKLDLITSILKYGRQFGRSGAARAQ